MTKIDTSTQLTIIHHHSPCVCRRWELVKGPEAADFTSRETCWPLWGIASLPCSHRCVCNTSLLPAVFQHLSCHITWPCASYLICQICFTVSTNTLQLISSMHTTGSAWPTGSQLAWPGWTMPSQQSHLRLQQRWRLLSRPLHSHRLRRPR